MHRNKKGHSHSWGIKGSIQLLNPSGPKQNLPKMLQTFQPQNVFFSYGKGVVGFFFILYVIARIALK